jgi:hypothetical protein
MVGRYSDEFMPTAFGDNMQKWGTNTILIESGGYKNDPEKQLIRKMNFLCIMAALYALATDKNNLPDFNPYFGIPENKKEKLFDLLIRNAQIQRNNRHFKIDIGIRRKELDNERFTDFTYLGEIAEIGDLSYYFGFEELDASELEVIVKDGELLIGKHADFQLVDRDNKIRYKIKNGF